jgi:Major Facilitator Superfamily
MCRSGITSASGLPTPNGIDYTARPAESANPHMCVVAVQGHRCVRSSYQHHLRRESHFKYNTIQDNTSSPANSDARRIAIGTSIDADDITTSGSGQLPPPDVICYTVDVLDKRIASVYELHSQRQRTFILLIAAVAAFVVTFSDTIYLPSLVAIEQDLHASVEQVSATVSLYMFAAAAANLIWGPLADRFGRRMVYLTSLAAFTGTALACLWAPSIRILLAFRALQGAAGAV